MTNYTQAITDLAKALDVDAANVADALDAEAGFTRLLGGGRRAVDAANLLEYVARTIRARDGAETDVMSRAPDVLKLLERDQDARKNRQRFNNDLQAL